MITGPQIRAARSLLNWGQAELAKKAGLTQATIANLELEKHSPTKTTSSILISTFEDAGVELLPDGVRKLKGIQEISGENAIFRLFDSIYNSMKTGGELLITGADERKNPPNFESTVNKLRKAGIQFRVLIEAGNTHLLAPLEEYRCVPKAYFSNIPTFIYRDKLALFIPSRRRPLIQVITSASLADSQRRLFEFMWDQGSMPKKSSARQIYFPVMKESA
jgi:DNA-binding XRE family transcriptional regulator